MRVLLTFYKIYGMKQIQYSLVMVNIWFIFFLVLSCGGSDNSLPEEEEDVKNEEEQIVDPVVGLTAKGTDKANELNVAWSNPPNIVSVEISYLQEGEDEANTVSVNVRVYTESKSSYTVKLPEYGMFRIGAVAINNYGKRSEKVTVTAAPAKEDAPPTFEIINDKLPIADPYVLYHNSKYYAYGTRINGFEVYISEDLTHWKRSESLALPPENSWGTRWFWAPEVYYVESKNRFYMFYSVDEHICVASATKPEGPFVQDERRPIVPGEKGIDTSLFIDDDGTPYLYYVRFTGGNVIWVAEMNDDLKSIKTETLTRCISAESQWERIQGTIAEGPSMLKKGDTYYLIYSANHYESKDYAVGYATASSPLGPWKKYSGNPILRRDKPAAAGLVGTGHGAPFVGADGNYRYIYHAHASTSSVGPRTSYINNLNVSEEGVITITGEPVRPVVIR
jgi:GH43 family beta-xylosidase